MTVSSNDSDDSTLVALIRAGDRAAFECLFRTHYAAMTRFAANFVMDYDAAEDIAQEVFSWVWTHHTEWNPASDPLAYLLTAVRNRAINVVATRQRRATLADEYVAANPNDGSPGGAAPALEPPDESGAVWGAIHRIPERRRTVLILRWRYDLDWETVARQMGIAVTAARMLHSRALRDLRRMLPDELE